MDWDGEEESKYQEAQKTREFFEEMVASIKGLGATQVTFFSKAELDALPAEEIKQRSPAMRRMWIRSRNTSLK